MENEEKRPEGSGNRPVSMLDNLFDIVNDLWGETQKDSAAAPDAAVEPDEPTVVIETEEKPFEQFWQQADESVDWTDALAHATPSDGLTDPALWAYFHEKAEQVLAGDLETYANVLRRVDPLQDMKPYTAACRVAIRSADKVCVTFAPAEGYLTGDVASQKRYLAGIALRCARDVMALLPLREVQVKALSGDTAVLDVTYRRSDLRDVHFAFVDPVALCERLGGVLTIPPEEDA